MISFLAFFIIFGILIIVHEFGHFIVAKLQGVRVERFSLGFGPRLLTKKKGYTEYSLSAIPLGGYVKLAGDSLEEYKGHSYEYFSKTPFQRATIIFFGPVLNYVLGFLCFWMIFIIGFPTLTTKVGSTIDGYGAKAAGLEVGDQIMAVDGEKVFFWDDLQKLIQSKKDAGEVKLLVSRANAERIVPVAIKEKQLDDPLGQKHRVGLIGITPADEIINVRHGPAKAFILGIQKTWDLTVLTYQAIWRMIGGKLSLKDSVTGPLGIFYITSKAASLGIIAILHLVAILSVSLAIFNLLPFPVLDGGHILLLIIEKIRGKTIGIKAERVITQVGMSVIIGLALVVTYNDIARFFGDKITKFFR